MKVLVIGRSYPSAKTGMFGTFEYDQALTLHNIGVEIKYCFLDTRPIYYTRLIGWKSLNDELDSEGLYIPIAHIPNPLYSMLKIHFFHKRFKRILDTFKPDIVHIHYPSIVLKGNIWPIIRDNAKIIVLTEHYSKVMNSTLTEKQKMELAAIYNNSNLVISVSDALRDGIKKICPESKVITIPNMISNQFVYKKKKRINSNTRFIYVGKIEKDKCVDKVIDAFAKLKEKCHNCELLIVGSGKEQFKIKRKILAYNISQSVRCFGNSERKEVNNLISNSDCFVTASKYETFCVPIIESWYCGNPVIVPNNYPICSYANKGNSLLYDNGNLHDLENMMFEFSNNKNYYNAKDISEEANNNFGWEKVGNIILQQYQLLLSKP